VYLHYFRHPQQPRKTSAPVVVLAPGNEGVTLSSNHSQTMNGTSSSARTRSREDDDLELSASAIAMKKKHDLELEEVVIEHSLTPPPYVEASSQSNSHRGSNPSNINQLQTLVSVPVMVVEPPRKKKEKKTKKPVAIDSIGIDRGTIELDPPANERSYLGAASSQEGSVGYEGSVGQGATGRSRATTGEAAEAAQVSEPSEHAKAPKKKKDKGKAKMVEAVEIDVAEEGTSWGLTPPKQSE